MSFDQRQEYKHHALQQQYNRLQQKEARLRRDYAIAANTIFAFFIKRN